MGRDRWALYSWHSPNHKAPTVRMQSSFGLTIVTVASACRSKDSSQYDLHSIFEFLLLSRVARYPSFIFKHLPLNIQSRWKAALVSKPGGFDTGTSLSPPSSNTAYATSSFTAASSRYRAYAALLRFADLSLPPTNLLPATITATRGPVLYDPSSIR
ncbi:hypothetical protein F4782DRAFT_38644 [Xylaria castorea]|nr:hypothetical protein F4782DRAFT_38644 [Xylaria castorea]